MWAASDIADWWDEQHRQAKKELDHFVENNPNLFGVVVATAIATAMEVGAGTVDTLRFGQGLAEGGVKSVGKDALRLIGLAGPLGRGAKIVQASANAKLARLIVDPGGGICGWVSGTQALRQTGTKAFAAVDDLAQALGKSIADFSGTSLSVLVASLRQVGARMGVLKSATSIDDIARMTLNNGGVTIFSVFGKRMEGGALKQVGHALYAYRDNMGRLRILDRGGSAGKLPEVFESLEALAKKYGIQGHWAIKEAAVMENVFAKVMGSISSAPVFAMDVYALAGVNTLEHETVAQAFEVHKVIVRQGKKALEQTNPRYHVVVPGDWLSKIAQKFYGDMRKWPVIYEANRDVIGGDPNAIKPGQRLLIPVLPKVSGIKG
jgi:hypothetical protein